MNKQRHHIKVITVVLIAATLGLISCSLNKKEKGDNSRAISGGVPEIQFDTTFCDLGTLTEGEKAAFTFKFKNTGTADLIIQDAYSTCGCTVPTYSQEPIAPGGEGKIEVIFDSEGRSGLQYKTVTLKLNTKISEKSLMIKANVIS